MFAYVKTTIRAEFLGVQEDVWLRVMDIVAQSGTGFAFPSQTLYFARDDGLDPKQTEAAEAQVRQWREEGRLPFPNFSPEQVQRMSASLVYPPPGSPDQPLPTEGVRDPGGRNRGQSAPTPPNDQGKEPTR